MKKILNTNTNGILSLFLALVMLLGMLPMNAVTAVAADTPAPEESTEVKAIMLGTGGINDPTASATSGDIYYTPSDYIYFGVNDSTPIKWRVLDADNANDGTTNGMFLLSEYLLGKNKKFEAAVDGNDGDGQTNPNEWQHSDAQDWCKDFANNGESFSITEQTAFLGVAKSDQPINLYGNDLGASSLTTDDKVFFLSAEELANYVGNYDRAPGLVATNTAQNVDFWWLRSPSATIAERSAVVSTTGSVNENRVDYLWRYRPAFNFNLDSVLFTSAAVGGKSGTTGTISEIPTSTTSEWKLTLKDSSRNFKVEETSALASPGSTVKLKYTGATIGANEYISVIITDGNGAKYYGRVMQPEAADGEVEIKIPADLPLGNYTLKVFSEQYNGGANDDAKLTDYASDFATISLTVHVCDCYNNGFCTECGAEHDPHSYINGFCTDCGGYEPAGLVDNVYQIGNPGQLVWFANYVNSGNYSANAVLIADIDMKGITFTPIAPITTLNYSDTNYTELGYLGTFDGGHHTISNLTITRDATKQATVGLFGTVSGEVKNLHIDNAYYKLAEKVDGRFSALVGQLLPGGKITDCIVSNSTVNNDGEYVAGAVAGCNYGGTIANCLSWNNTVSANTRCGNLVGDNQNDATDTAKKAVGEVQNCYSTSSLAGGNGGTGTVTNSIANITSEDAAKVVYLLNGSSSTGAWKLSDGVPAFEGDTVYQNTCGGDIFYSTTQGNHDKHSLGSNFLCTNCGVYDSATLVSEDNREGFDLSTDYVGYYAIENESQLYWFAQLVNLGHDGVAQNKNAKAVLLADLDLKNNTWYPIGLYQDPAFKDGENITSQYGGTFDGNGHTVSNFTATGNGSQGLIGYTSKNVIVKNLGVINATVSGWNAGAILAYYGTVENCFAVDCTISAGTTSSSVTVVYAGAIAGSQYATVNNCFAVNCAVNHLEGDTITANLAPIGGKTVTNSYYSGITSNETLTIRDGETEVTSEQLASGEVAYLLNKGVTDGTQAWYQTIGTDTQPKFTGDTVYSLTCTGFVYGYGNEAASYDAHDFGEDGLCTRCAVYNFKTDAEGNYLIYTDAELAHFAHLVNLGNNKINAKLMNNLNMNGFMIGTLEHPYGGTFDGNGKTITVTLESEKGEQYVAPFRYVNGATIKNLNVAGTITAADKFAAGIAGSVNGTGNVIEKCIVSVVINSSVDGDGTHGGLVGVAESGSAITVNYCGFIGQINGASTNSCGGFIGWSNATNSSIKNSYVAATFTVSGTNSATFSRGTVPTINNCYYLNALGTTQGTNVAAGDLTSGALTWKLNGSSAENPVWKQTIGIQNHPNFDGGVVNYDSGTGTYSNSGDYVNVTISWTQMSFTYEHGTWDPTTHTFGKGAWTPDTEGGGKITVQNNASPVYVSLSFAGSVDGVSGSFDKSSDVLSSEETATYTFAPVGKPTGVGFTDQPLGTVSIKLSLNPITTNWKVGDKVEYIAADGNVYTATVGERTDEKAVIVSEYSDFISGRYTKDGLLGLVESVGARYPYSNELSFTSVIIPWLNNELSDNYSWSDYSPVYQGDTLYLAYKYNSATVNNTEGTINSERTRTYYYRYIWDVPLSD